MKFYFIIIKLGILISYDWFGIMFFIAISCFFLFINWVYCCFVRNVRVVMKFCMFLIVFKYLYIVFNILNGRSVYIFFRKNFESGGLFWEYFFF